MRLKVASKAQGGRDLAVQTIERTYIQYANATKMKRDYSPNNQGMNSAILEPHPCVDLDYIEKSNTFNFFRKWGSICSFTIFMIIVYLYGFIGLFPAIERIAMELSYNRN